MWQKLKEEKKPVVLYGTGDAAEKIIKELDARGIRVSGIFASDGFVRDRSFAGHKVRSYSQCCEEYGKMCVILCFGSHRPDVMENIVKISREQDLYAPDLPVAGDGLFDRVYYDSNRALFEKVRSLLADEESRSVFDKVIEYKLTGMIDPLLECSTPESDNWDLLFTGRINEDLQKRIEGAGSKDLTFLDLGAYTGDTAELFLRKCGGKANIIAVEPEKRNFRKLSENLQSRTNTELVHACIGECDGEALFEKGTGRGGSKVMQTSGAFAHPAGRYLSVPQRRIDSIMSGRRADIIKMDIEGAEAAAIKGGEATIKAYAPNMLVAAYHRTEDLFAIPLQVLSIVPEYSVYLRKDPCIPAWGVNYFFTR